MRELANPKIYSSIISNKSRNIRLDEIKKKQGGNITSSYLNFGKDYFDNPEILEGFGAYLYDGRYENCVKNWDGLGSYKGVLDFGCAKGYLLYEFHRLGKKVVGVDVSDYARNTAKEEIKNCIYQQIQDIPEEHCKNIELIISRDVFPHIDEEKLSDILKAMKNKFQNLKEIYLEFMVDDGKNISQGSNDLFVWDPTTKIIKTKEHWGSYLEKFELPISIHYKALHE